ncbi:MAG: SET domain-containing protein-lysine N-methyltransferase [Candidatus Diapherotrites archaeon]|nr:SET domain-containing protein-lysine N-methyltransferase [Candidatus Diapherotrites archaeon]
MVLLASYRSPKVRVLNSSNIDKKGIFAIANISEGETVFVKAGHIVDNQTAKELENKLGEYCLQISDNLNLCPTTKKEVKETAIFVNHSCDPNIGPRGQIVFIAIRNIKAGEELCYDYAMTTARQYNLKCECGTRVCRKKITGEDWKIKSLQKRYKNHFSDFILQKIKKQ